MKNRIQNIIKTIVIVFPLLTIVSCGSDNEKADAYGNFEATEILISSEANGKIIYSTIEEGKYFDNAGIAVIVDTTELQLKKNQLLAQRRMIQQKTNIYNSQLQVYQQQKDNINIDKQRIEKMLKDGAATQKQMDDINANIKLIDKQENTVKVQNATVIEELNSIDAQIASIDYSIQKSKVIIPSQSTILEKYAEQGELISLGKPICKIANLNDMILKAYFTGEQLSQIKVGDEVNVRIDSLNNSYMTVKGQITWISPYSEFTPKIIQTKEERVNLVYAVKIRVKNNGMFKIGMPGEVMILNNKK